MKWSKLLKIFPKRLENFVIEYLSKKKFYNIVIDVRCTYRYYFCNNLLVMDVPI